jgi:UDP-N-acetylglucosamine 4,6-dehydratase
VLSTDKAVYPINAMGISKAMMEKVMVATSAQPGPHRHRALRHALRQRDGLARLGDPAVRDRCAPAGRSPSPTRPMTRFMMSLEESGGPRALRVRARRQRRHLRAEGARVDGRRSRGGAARTADGRDNEIRIIGTRHGEKLYESLVSREEMATRSWKTSEAGYYRI